MITVDPCSTMVTGQDEQVSALLPASVTEPPLPEKALLMVMLVVPVTLPPTEALPMSS